MTFLWHAAFASPENGTSRSEHLSGHFVQGTYHRNLVALTSKTGIQSLQRSVLAAVLQKITAVQRPD